jgi:hypothetical protein
MACMLGSLQTCNTGFVQVFWFVTWFMLRVIGLRVETRYNIVQLIYSRVQVRMLDVFCTTQLLLNCCILDFLDKQTLNQHHFVHGWEKENNNSVINVLKLVILCDPTQTYTEKT